MKIPEHKDEAETTLWTTEAKKDHIRRVKGVTTLTGLPLPQTGTGLNGEDSSRSLVSPGRKRDGNVNIQFPQHLWVTSQEPQLGLASHGCVCVCLGCSASLDDWRSDCAGEGGGTFTNQGTEFSRLSFSSHWCPCRAQPEAFPICRAESVVLVGQETWCLIQDPKQ